LINQKDNNPAREALNMPEIKIREIVFSLILISLVSGVSASSSYGDGSDGSLTVTGSTIVNDYTYLTGDETSGSSSLAVNDASKFSSGDEIMIIQMQNGTGNGVAGRYEFREVDSTESGTLYLEDGTTDNYFSGSFSEADDELGEVTQVISIPEYSNLTIDGGKVTAPDWDGRTGGIVSFRVSDKLNFTSGGEVDVAGIGFRGGDCHGCGNDDWGDQGESYTGLGSATLDRNGIGGGGGYGPTGNGGEPAGGGGYATAGENSIGGSTTSEGGTMIGKDNLSVMFFGGGGGAGGDNDGYTPYPQGSDGGGIVYISAQEIYNAKIDAEGDDGKTGTDDNAYGGNSGGGAGGSVFLRGTDIDIDLITAKGGDRSPDDGDGEQGGAGGDGRIRLDYNSASGISNVNPDPGYTGDAPDFCDERGPLNQCYIKSERDISSQSVEIVEPFAAFSGSEIFSSTFSPFSVQNSANISGTFRGSLNFSADGITLKPGARFVPENGRVLLENR
jgi:hypothetical protein